MASGDSARDEAHRFEREGRFEDAARAFLAAGSLPDAVRVFAQAKRYLAAAELLMRAIGVTPSEVGVLRGERRRLAHRAALYFSAARHYHEALAILDALGDSNGASKVRQRAAGRDEGPVSTPPMRLSEPAMTPPPPPSSRQTSGLRSRQSSKPKLRRTSKPTLDPNSARALAARLEARGDLELAKTAYARLGAHAEVARLAEKSGDFVEAAKAWAQTGRQDEAGRCQLAAGNEEAALEELLRLSVDLPGYRVVAARAIRLARKLSRLDLELDSFVQQLLSTGVTRQEELEAFYDLARLYESQGHLGRACATYERIEAYESHYRDVAHRLVVSRSRARVASGPSLSDDAVSERWKSHQRLAEIHRSSVDRLESDRAPQSGLPPLERHTPRPPSDDGSNTESSSAPPPPSDSGLAGGSVIGGRYRVKRQIGRGSTSEVYEVLDLDLHTIVALKLFASSVDSRGVLSRCRRELVLARELTHENIVRVHDIGEHEDRRFITMEMLDGTDLRAVMEESLPSWSQSLRYLVQACDGLHAAHMHGVVHRDVKPENFFVTTNEQLKVMDFGIATKASDAEEITIDGRTAGTPIYMSPEQIRDYSGVSPVSDVYSLGIVAYELLTGEAPFSSDDSVQLMLMHVQDNPPPPTWLEPELPVELEALILQALEKTPERRVKSCREMAERLKAVFAKMT